MRRFRNGDSISYVTDNNAWYTNNSTAQCCAYQNDQAYVPAHGLLYSVAVLQDPRGACPAGWHPATDEDWKQLETHLGVAASELDSLTMPGPFGAWRGGNENVGGQLKALITWDGPNTGANNSSGFNAFASGERTYLGNFIGMGEVASFWAAYPAQWLRKLSYLEHGSFRYHNGMGSDQSGYGHSCRCVKD